MRGPHSSSPRRRSPPLFRRSRKNPPHRQRRQHPPLEPLRPPPRIPSRIPRPAPWPNQLRILRHPTHPNPPPRPNPLTRSGHFQVAPVAQPFLAVRFFLLTSMSILPATLPQPTSPPQPQPTPSLHLPKHRSNRSNPYPKRHAS